MIKFEEINQKAQEFEIHSSNVQRDYVFSWLLNGFFTTSELKDQIFLKGGNALRKGYFRNSRFSKDLDFGIPGDISQEKLLLEVNKICDYIQKKTGIEFYQEKNKVEEKFSNFDNLPLPDLKVYEIRTYFNDFYGKESDIILRISMDLTRFDKVTAPIQTLKLLHPYSDSQEVECEIRCMKLEEIIATKLKCLLQRQHTPDLFDYAYSIKLLGGNLNKEEVVKLLIEKTIFDRNPHMLKDILKTISMSYFREYWEKSLICARQFLMGVEEAIGIFTTDLDKIFQIYPDNGYRDFAYFAPQFRNPIMEAGRNQTVLKIRYKGYDRLVEPYALKYQIRRDGRAKEYFYAYNLSGGSHLPGMRSFVSENMEFVENTDQKFSPNRGYPIELSKAGETPENPYLFDPNKPLKRATKNTLRTRFSSGIKYSYQCSTCGRKFTRSSPSGYLNDHKNKSGSPCYGRYGIYLETKYP